MAELHGWLEAQLAEKKAEPNSGLGQAITYLLRHWRGLTTFLREANVPLDNNLCERVETSRTASKKRTVLQNDERCAGRRLIYEPHSHLLKGVDRSPKRMKAG
jgi:transposase